jgi:hypothetical protein
MTTFRKRERAMSKRPGAGGQGKRQAASAQSSSSRQQKSIAGGRWRSGPHSRADRRREPEPVELDC